MSYEAEEEFFEDDLLTDHELAEIQEEYRRQKLKESLVGPVISTAVHVCLLVICAVFFTGEVVKKNETVEITPIQEEIPPEEPPPPPPPPEIPPPEPQEVISHDPQVTSDAVPDAADLVGAIDDVSDEPPSTDDNAEADLVNDIKPSASSIVSSKMFGGRSAAGRAGALKSYGGSAAAQQSLNKALKWLAKVQKPDGSWGDDIKATDGLTGLALLVFLAHGETPKSKQYGKTVSSAIRYLAESPMDLAARHGYAHAIKTYALAEAYAMTGMYEIEAPLEECATALIEGQLASGAYEYLLNGSDKRKKGGDISIGGWVYQALKAVKSSGLEIDGLEATVDKAVNNLKKLAPKNYPYLGDLNSNTKNLGLMGVGTLCLQLFGEAQGHADSDRIMDIIKDQGVKSLDWNNAPKHSMYGWYYQTFASFQKGGDHWKAWNKKFQPLLKNNQNPEGFWEYAGGGPAMKGEESIRVYATTLACLMLTVYYRYLPSTSIKKRSLPAKTAKKKVVEHEEEVNIF